MEISIYSDISPITARFKISPNWYMLASVVAEQIMLPTTISD